MASPLFLDTGYVIALSSPRDRYHDAALQWERHIRADSVPVVTTRAVQLEIGAAFSRLAYRAAATVGHQTLLDSQTGTIPPITSASTSRRWNGL